MARYLMNLAEYAREELLTLLNNASVANFLGAMFAFLFLVAYDRHKDRKGVQYIANEIDRARAHSTPRLESTRRNLAAIRESNKIHGADFLRFDVAMIKRLLTETWHMLAADQQRAIDAIVHRIEGTDRLLEEVYRLTLSLIHISEPTRPY